MRSTAAQASGAGEADGPDQGLHRQRSASSWGGCGHRGDAHMHVHPRRAEGECHHHHIGVLRSLPQLGEDKERIPEPDQVNHGITYQ